MYRESPQQSQFTADCVREEVRCWAGTVTEDLRVFCFVYVLYNTVIREVILMKKVLLMVIRIILGLFVLPETSRSIPWFRMRSSYWCMIICRYRRPWPEGQGPNMPILFISRMDMWQPGSCGNYRGIRKQPEHLPAVIPNYWRILCIRISR